MDLKNSITKENLMRAFAGESQAANRYRFAAGQARKDGIYVVGAVFDYTANQEQSHAKVFYQHLKELAGETIVIDGGYPVDISKEVCDLLTMAKHNEFEEHDSVYKAFANTAEEEGFAKVAASFRMIAEIEKIHGERFERLANLMEKKELFVSAVETQWICLNCGHVSNGKKAPDHCPVCNHDQGFFIRLELSPFEGRLA